MEAVLVEPLTYMAWVSPKHPVVITRIQLRRLSGYLLLQPSLVALLTLDARLGGANIPAGMGLTCS
jgi:hypothetical protein